MIEVAKFLLVSLTTGATVFFTAAGVVEFMSGNHSKNWGVLGWAITGGLWLLGGAVLQLASAGLKAVLA